MNGCTKVTWLFGGCLFYLMPLFLQAQAGSNVPITPSPLTVELKKSFPVPPAAPSAVETQPLPDDVSKLPLGTDRMLNILNFWFGVLPEPGFFPEDKMSIWFANTPEIDRQIRDHFFQDVINAERGDYNHWRETPQGRLALILLLDLFPRHIYRNKPRAFTLDRMARALALEGIQKGEDKDLYPIERAFFYLPLEHAEDLGIQNLAVASYRQLVAHSPKSIQPQMQAFLQAAILHQQQIARFGRFPYRNAILGRVSTSEETVFLMQRGVSEY